MPEGIHGIRRTFPAEFDLTYLKVRVPFNRPIGHLCPDVGGCHDFSELVGRTARNYEENPIQGKLFRDLLSHQEMAHMGRIEGTTKKAEAKRAHASVHPLLPTTFTAPIRSDLLGSL